MNIGDVAKWDYWNRHLSPRYPNEKVVQFVLRNFSSAPRAITRILDLGCGSGTNTVFLAGEGFDTHAMDISAAGVQKASKWLEQRGLDAKMLVADVVAIPYRDKCFDAVICIGVIECAGKATVSTSFSEIVRVLKPGGLAFIICAASDDFRITGTNPLGLEGFERREIEERAMAVAASLMYAHIDDYLTTYEGGRQVQHDFIVTLRRDRK